MLPEVCPRCSDAHACKGFSQSVVLAGHLYSSEFGSACKALAHAVQMWMLSAVKACQLAVRQTCLVCASVLEPALNASELRGAALAAAMPIHYYMFNATGRLLYANKKACQKLQQAGESPACMPCMLALLSRWLRGNQQRAWRSLVPKSGP